MRSDALSRVLVYCPVAEAGSTTICSALSERGGDIDRGFADRRRMTPAAGRSPGARRTNGYGGWGLRG